MREITARLSAIKAGRFMFKPFERSDNFHIFWKETVGEVVFHKAKFIILIENYERYDLDAISKRLKENMSWLKQNAYLTTKSSSLIVINFHLVRRYGEVGVEGFADFLTWLKEKVTSEGHRLAHIEESEFLLSKQTVSRKQSKPQSKERKHKDDVEDQKDFEAEEGKEDKPYYKRFGSFGSKGDGDSE